MTTIYTDENIKASLSNEILRSYNQLIQSALKVPKDCFFKKCYLMFGSQVSAADIISYQIGWGSLLINWYKSGITNERIVMPGDGFDKWDYKNIALHFFQKYSLFPYEELFREFEALVEEIIKIVENEACYGNLDKLGIWGSIHLTVSRQVKF